MTGIPTDDELTAAQKRFDTDPTAFWDVADVEKRHLAGQPALESGTTLKRGTIVLDEAGDAWRYGNTRWTCMTPVDGTRILRVARLGTGDLIRDYGPVRIIGGAAWKYRTIRGRP